MGLGGIDPSGELALVQGVVEVVVIAGVVVLIYVVAKDIDRPLPWFPSLPSIPKLPSFPKINIWPRAVPTEKVDTKQEEACNCCTVELDECHHGFEATDCIPLPWAACKASGKMCMPESVKSGDSSGKFPANGPDGKPWPYDPDHPLISGW